MIDETGNPDKLTHEDIRQAHLVEQMRQHKGYEVLVEFWNAQRETILQMGKQAVKVKDTATAAGYWMMLDGFDKACSMVDKIAARAEDEEALSKLEKEGKRYAEQ